MRARMSVGVCALALGLALAPRLLVGQANTPIVAVLYFDNNSFGKDRADYDGLGKGIADLLINDMAANPSMRVVERERIQSVLQEHSLVQAKSIDPQTAVRLGKLLGAQYMITGGFLSDGKGTLLVTSRVINVETGAITNPLKLESKGGEDVLGLIGQLSAKLNADLKLPPMPRQTGEAGASRPSSDVDGKPAGREPAPRNGPGKSQKLDVKTALLYSKALDEQDGGNPQKAAELYRAVLQRFPDFGPARQNLAKVQKSGD